MTIHPGTLEVIEVEYEDDDDRGNRDRDHDRDGVDDDIGEINLDARAARQAFFVSPAADRPVGCAWPRPSPGRGLFPPTAS